MISSSDVCCSSRTGLLPYISASTSQFYNDGSYVVNIALLGAIVIRPQASLQSLRAP